MHAGLLRPDGQSAPVWEEVERLKEELKKLDLASKASPPAKVALVADDASHWIYTVQPQGASFDLKTLNLTFYSACRRLGLDVDVVRPGDDISDYALVLIPSLPLVSKAMIKALTDFEGSLVVGPRSGSKTRTMQTPQELPPGDLQTWLPLKVIQVSSLPPGVAGDVIWKNRTYPLERWQERIESDLVPSAYFTDGTGAIYPSDRWHYLGFWPTEDFLMDYLEDLLNGLGIDTMRLSERLRLRRRGDLTFAFNTGDENATAPAPESAAYVLGGPDIPPCDVAVWTR